MSRKILRARAEDFFNLHEPNPVDSPSSSIKNPIHSSTTSPNNLHSPSNKFRIWEDTNSRNQSANTPINPPLLSQHLKDIANIHPSNPPSSKLLSPYPSTGNRPSDLFFFENLDSFQLLYIMSWFFIYLVYYLIIALVTSADHRTIRYSSFPPPELYLYTYILFIHA